jgi:hypothetical protein
MAESSPAGYASSSSGIAAEWTGVLAGPIAFALDLLISYSLVKWTCDSQHTAVLHLITLGALLLIAGGAFAAWTALAATPAQASSGGGRPVDRARFMALLGLTMCAFFTVVVIANGVPRIVLDACQG